MTLNNIPVAQPSIWSLPQRFLKKELLPVLTDLRLAILLLLAIALFSISGTVIEQGQPVAFYQANYPEDPALFGFLSWKVLLAAGLDHVYRTWWYLSLLILFGVSLTACTFTRQLPALKASRKWKFYDQPRQFQKLALSAEVDTGTLSALTQLLQSRRYLVFPGENNNLYARKGIAGRIGPIVVHIGIVAILAGGIWGAMTGFIAQEMVPSGDNFAVKNIVDAGPWAAPQIPHDWSLRVNRFWIDYTPNGGIDQFYSDLSVLDRQGEEVKRKTIFVNEPLRYKGVTLYQTDWGVSGVRIRVNKSPVLQLPMAKLNTNGQGRIWGTWIPTKTDMSEGVSLLARDLQGMLLLYDVKGQLISTLRSGMSTQVNGVTLYIDELVGSTGLQIKADPSIPVVYTGFTLLMLGVVMSYVSHSQIWALQQDGRFYVGGKTNRAQVGFEQEMLDILAQLTAQKQVEDSEVKAELVAKS